MNVQLHKMKKAQEPVKAGGRLAKSTSPVSPDQDAKDLDNEAYGPVETTGRRKVVGELAESDIYMDILREEVDMCMWTHSPSELSTYAHNHSNNRSSNAKCVI